MGDLFWLFLAVAMVLPAILRTWLSYQRQQALKAFQERRGTRVITLIHRQETISILGLPVSRYIDIEDSELVLTAIRLTPVSCFARSAR